MDTTKGRISGTEDFYDFKDLLKLFKLYSVPGAFVSERLHSVACSFGSAEDEDNSTCRYTVPSSYQYKLTYRKTLGSIFYARILKSKGQQMGSTES